MTSARAQFAFGLCALLLAGGAATAQDSTRDVRASMYLSPECPPADGPENDPTYPIRKLAFDAIAALHPADAQRLMRCAFAANPKDLVALKQLVYLDLNDNKPAAASEDIDALRRLGSSTAQFEAQQGYIEAKAGHIDEARAAFGRAIALADAAKDTKLHAQVMRAIRVLDGEYPNHVFETSFDGEYLSRFDDGIVDVSERYFERLGAHSPFSAYLGARLLRDTASEVGPLPQIFSDNALMFGPGLVFKPHGAHYTLSTEVNFAYVFYGSTKGTAVHRNDLRTVLGYYNTWHPADGRVYVEANGSVGFYARYQHDGIAYVQPREGLELTRESDVRVMPFVGESLALDSNRDFYNNIFELVPGLELGLRRYPNLSLRGEYVRGFYLAIPGVSANPYGPGYNDFRVRLTFQKNATVRTGNE